MELVFAVLFKYITLLALSAVLVTCVAWIDDLGPQLKSPRWIALKAAILATTVGTFGVMLRILSGNIQPDFSVTLFALGIGIGMAAHVEVGWWNFVWKGCARRPPRGATTSQR